MTLTEAIQIIRAIHEVLGSSSEVAMFEVEDGSRMRFNYRLKHDTQNRYIDLKPYHDKLEEVRQKAELVKNLEMWVYTSFSETISVRGKEHVTERINQILNKI